MSLLSDLTHLSEREAIQRSFDDHNRSVLRWGLAPATAGALAGVIASSTSGRPELIALWGLALVVDLLWIVGRKRRWLLRHARQALIAFLLSHALAAVFSMGLQEPQPAYVFAGYLFPATLLLFRMRWFEFVALQAAFVSAGVWFALRPEMSSAVGPRVGMLAGMAVFVLIVTGLAIRMTRRRGTAFLGLWHTEVAREAEEARMRGELLDAREIQLSMLPRTTPDLEWLDSSGLSIPAHEVGGDYYEYFELDGDRMALVIGDVAGHGVASGLVLSGVRSGLYLLRDELVRPVDVIERLNSMVRDTAPQRMFVTLQIAVLDRRRSTVTLANAGHPPLLLMAADDPTPRPVGSSGLPLGTRLDASFTEVSHDLAAGDTLVFHTDGVIEARDLAGAEFGAERLMTAARKASSGSTARQVRDSIVSAVSRFRGDAVQTDDLTLVVLRLAELGLGR